MINRLFEDRGNSISIIFLFVSLISLVGLSLFLFLTEMYSIFPKSLPSGQYINSNIINTFQIMIRDFLLIYSSVLFLSFYLVPRLTGKTFIGLKLVTVIAGLISVVPLISLFFPFESKNSFGIPKSLSVVLLMILILFTLFTAISFFRRAEKSLFVSGYFLLASLTSLTAATYSMQIDLKTTADLTIVNSFFTSSQIYIGTGFASLCIIFFLATKGIGGTLDNKSLSSISLWGYLFLFPWVGFQFYYGTFLPNWIENISIYMSLGLVVPLLAFLSNIIKTIQSSSEERGLPYKYLTYSIFLFTIGNVLVIVGGIPSIIPLVSFTVWSRAIKLAFIFSLVSGLLGLYSYAIPKLLGREFRKDTVFHNMYIVGATLMVISLATNGIISGYVWTAGANAGTLTTFGEGYQIVWEATSQFYYFSALGSTLLFTSLGMFFINTLRSISSGSIVAQEVLKGVPDYE